MPELRQISGMQETKMHSLVRQASLAFALIGSTVAVSAQQYLGSIGGKIEDVTGSKVAHIPVVVTDEQTHFKTSGQSNGDGVYNIQFLQPGTYSVLVEGQGFAATEHTGIVVTAGDNKISDFRLDAKESISVEVTTDSEVMDTGGASQGVTLSSKDVTDIPNPGRYAFNLATLSDGFTSDAFDQRKAAQNSGISIGQQSNGLYSSGRITLNGIPNDPPERTTGNFPGFLPSLESIQEVKVQTTLYDAQYGHTNGALINAVLRTGQNDYHGAVYYVFQNTYANANTYERAGAGLPRANDQRSQPGFVVDGPVRIPHLYDGRNRTFFLGSYERLHTVTANTNVGSVPTLKMRQGDFSELLSPSGTCTTGSYVCLYDPLSATAAGVRTAFPNNDLSKAISPIGQKMLNQYPLPNVPGTGPLGLTSNYIAVQTSTPDYEYNTVLRLDQNLGARNKLTLAYLRARGSQFRTDNGYSRGAGPGFAVIRNNEGGSVDLVTILSPTMVLDSRVGGIYHPFSQIANGYHYDLGSLGFNPDLISKLPTDSFPRIAPGQGLPALQSGASVFSNSVRLDVLEVLSQSVGKHSLHYGVQYDLLRFNLLASSSAMVFSFNQKFTQALGSRGAGYDTHSGYSYADLALGYPVSGTQTTNTPLSLQQHYFAAFLQDDWRISRKLTLNLGLRWDLEEPYTDRRDSINAGFCTSCVSPFQVAGLPRLQGGLLFATPDARFPTKRDRDNFQPRFGLAYKLNSRQVLRVGAGVIYKETEDLPENYGYSSTTTYSAVIDATSGKPTNSLANPYPGGLSVPTQRSLGLGTGIGQAIQFQNRDHVLPKLYQTSATIQTSFPSRILFEFGYVGNFNRDLELTRNINALPAQYFSLGGPYLQASVPNPMAGLVPNNATLNAATIQRQFLLLPFPQFGTITEESVHTGSLNYNSLRVRLDKRLANNFSMHANYTWAKIMRTDYRNDQDENPSWYQDPQPNQIINVVALYQLPTFRKSPFYIRELLGGWQTNFVARKTNGIAVANPANVIPLADPAQGVQRTYGHMFNTCYLTASGALTTTSTDCGRLAPAFQQEAYPSFTLQTIRPYMDRVRNIVKPRLDVSAFKKFSVHDAVTFEIRGEAFNVLNSVNFTVPDTSLTGVNYGAVTYTQTNDARILQLTGRINF